MTFAPQQAGISPRAGAFITPEQAAKEQECVSMRFPLQVVFTPEQAYSVVYPAGVHSVPKLWSDHWFLEAQGAKICDEKPDAESGGDRSKTVVLNGHNVAMTDLEKGK